ncbi:MAG: EAL domain-containing protein [Methylococcales bacterium]|nr:EAL domain-containing protein [Methylococcales bacterium]
MEILIVDDESRARESLSNILVHHGYKVAAVDGVLAAINYLKQHPVKLVLLDLMMPTLSGQDLLDYIADNCVDSHVIIVSVDSTFAAARQTLRMGFVYDFIRKPYAVEELVQVVAKVFDIIKLKEDNKSIQHQLLQSEQMHRFFIENSPDIVYLLNEKGEFSFLNNIVTSILGYDEGELNGKHYTRLIFADDLKKADALFNTGTAEYSTARTTELRLICKNTGQPKYVEITANAMDHHAIEVFRDKVAIDDDQSFIYGVIRDVNDRKSAEYIHLAVEHNPNLIVIFDKNGVIEYVNQKITDTTGYLAEEVIGRNPRMFNSEDTTADESQELWKTISSGNIWRGILKNKKKSGEIYWTQEAIAPMIDSDGNITNYVSIQEDVTKTRLLAEKLSYQASHDSLTNLINRHEFDLRLERVTATAQGSDTEHALCYIDLDQFKIINDTCSHAAGDELLRQISAQLSKVIRRRDTLARLGGDEFAILMEHCPLEQAEITTQKIHKMIEQFQFHWEDKSFRIGASMGLVVINTRNGSANIHLKQADMACYIAKATGRNRTHIYREDDKALVQYHGEMNWVERINRALDEDLFCLYTQSIVPLSVNDGEYCEILIRMKDTDGSLIAPNAFLPAADRYQLSTRIDCWVIRSVFDYFIKHADRLNSLSLCFINLSGSSLNDPKLLSFIEDQFKQARVPAQKICFEITETAAIANLTTATDFINRLKAYGCKFCLDDFGSGLSSFAYLKNLPVDFLKIDGFFVKDMEHDLVDFAMVKAINEIGQIMGKKTIAEFVENEKTLKILRELKVDYVQGHFTGRPKSIYDWGTLSKPQYEEPKLLSAMALH